MANPPGSFIWYELMTPDPDAVKEFYKAVVGWTISERDGEPAGGLDYRMISRRDGKAAGGVLRLTDDMVKGGARPVWLGYLYTPDVDATVAAVAADGGTVQMPPSDVPHAGRIAMVTDPQHIPFYVMTPTPPPGDPDAVSGVFARTGEQRVNWNELTTTDIDGAKAFYGRHFGFAFNESMDMGEAGPYCFIDHGGARIGAVMRRQSPQQPIRWLFYIGVPSAGAAKEAIEKNGGTVLIGPDPVPTGEFTVLATDPAGAGFAVVGAA